jgi:hypothetical protein
MLREQDLIPQLLLWCIKRAIGENTSEEKSNKEKRIKRRQKGQKRGGK